MRGHRCQHRRTHDWELNEGVAYGKPVKLYIKRCRTCQMMWTRTPAEMESEGK